MSRVESVCQASANNCALRCNEGFFAGARVIGVVGFASESESYCGRFQREIRNPMTPTFPSAAAPELGGLVTEVTIQSRRKSLNRFGASAV
jgi:hypothetical protein